MANKSGLIAVGRELAERAPTATVFKYWRLWYFGTLFVLVSLLLVAAGIYLSLHFSDWDFLSRFGALEVILGSYLIGRPMWRRRFKSRYVNATLIKDGKISPEQLAEYIMERTDIWFFYIGFVIAAVGSVVWGFADLLNCFLPCYEHHCTTPALLNSG